MNEIKQFSKISLQSRDFLRRESTHKFTATW